MEKPTRRNLFDDDSEEEDTVIKTEEVKEPIA
jgi:hypothetical protein